MASLRHRRLQNLLLKCIFCFEILDLNWLSLFRVLFTARRLTNPVCFVRVQAESLRYQRLFKIAVDFRVIQNHLRSGRAKVMGLDQFLVVAQIVHVLYDLL